MLRRGERAMRLLTPHTISYPIVPSRSAHSSALTRSSSLLADQHDFVADRDRIVADIDHQLIHRHHTDDGAASAADEHLAAGLEQAPRHPVGVPDGNRGDGRRSR